jgi:uncharacterized protein YggE
MKRFAVFALLASLSAAALASPLPAYPFVSTSGKAQLWLAPDIGELQFDTGAQHVDAAQAAKALEAVSNTVLAMLAEQGIPAEDIECFELSRKSVALSKASEDGQSNAWSLARHFRVNVRDLKLWPQIIAGLLAIDHIDSVGTSFDRTDSDELNRGLMKGAADDARKNAALLAQSFGRKLGPAVAISRGALGRIAAPFIETSSTAMPRPPRTPASSYDVPPSIPFAQSVNTIFKLQ